MNMSRICDHRNTLLTYDTILFDLDGTLYNTMQFYKGAFEDMGRWLVKQSLVKHPAGFVDGIMALQSARGTDDKNLIDDALSWFRIAPAVKQNLLQVYRSHDCRYLHMNERDAGMLLELGSVHKQLFLITNGHRAVQQQKISRLGIGTWMKKIIILDPAEKRILKPDRKAFQELAKQYRLGRSLMVGDRWDVDGQFAENCGIDYLGVWCNGN